MYKVWLEDIKLVRFLGFVKHRQAVIKARSSIEKDCLIFFPKLFKLLQAFGNDTGFQLKTLIKREID